MNKPDRRIDKTRNAIFEALSELLREKKYANITIQNIIDRANVGRTTFYSHFPTKDDLLSSYIENIFESFNEQLTEHVPKGHEGRLLPVVELLTHIKENERSINGVLMSESGELLFNKFKSYWNLRIEPYLLGQIPDGKKPKVPIDILTDYVTSTVVELIRFWLKSGKSYTPSQMEQYLFELINPSVQSALAVD